MPYWALGIGYRQSDYAFVRKKWQPHNVDFRFAGSMADALQSEKDAARYYLNLPNMQAADVIKNRHRNRGILEFLGTWEMLYNSNLKGSNSPPLEWKPERFEALFRIAQYQTKVLLEAEKNQVTTKLNSRKSQTNKRLDMARRKRRLLYTAFPA